MLLKHSYKEKYNPDNYAPGVYDFLGDFSDEELAELRSLNWENPAAYEQNLITVTQAVHGKYSYKKRKKSLLALDAETVGNSRQVDCYGYSLALSQMLTNLDISHQIAFANTHAFVIAENEAKLYLLDALSPEISGELSLQNVCHTDCLKANVFAINIMRHINDQSTISDKSSFFRKHPWTNLLKNRHFLGSGHRDEVQPARNSNIYIRTYSPESGTKALYAYDQYRQATEQKQYSRAYFMSKVLSRAYPEIDIRNKPKPAENLITDLGRLGLVALASKTIDRTAQARQVAENYRPKSLASRPIPPFRPNNRKYRLLPTLPNHFRRIIRKTQPQTSPKIPNKRQTHQTIKPLHPFKRLTTFHI